MMITFAELKRLEIPWILGNVRKHFCGSLANLFMLWHYHNSTTTQSAQRLTRDPQLAPNMATTPINQSDSHPSNPTTPSAENYGVIFVLGGPGAGKGTQCAMLAQEFQLQHLSVGDVLRAERDTPGSQYGELVAHNMYEGKVGPMEVTVKLLHKAMEDAVQRDGIEVFLIDGKLHSLCIIDRNVQWWLNVDSLPDLL